MWLSGEPSLRLHARDFLCRRVQDGNAIKHEPHTLMLSTEDRLYSPKDPTLSLQEYSLHHLRDPSITCKVSFNNSLTGIGPLRR